MLSIKNGLVPGDRGLERRDVYVRDGVVTDAPAGQPDEVIDAEGLAVLPGMIDIHMHGADGVDVAFNLSFIGLMLFFFFFFLELRRWKGGL